MVKYIKQKQQQELQPQSLLPPELDTLTLHQGGLPNIKGELPVFRPLEYVVKPGAIALIPTVMAVIMKWYQLVHPDSVPNGFFPENEVASCEFPY